MRTSRSLLFLLTMLPALSWAQTTLLPTPRRPTAGGTVNAYIDPTNGNRLMYISKSGPPAPATIDSAGVTGLSAKFITERLYQATRLSQERQTSNGLYRGANQPFTIPQIPGLADSLGAKLTRQEYQQLLSDTTKGGYTKPQANALFAAQTTTAQSFAVRTARASVAQIRADASSVPADFFQLSDFRRPRLYRRDSFDTSTSDDGVLCIVTSAGVRFKLVTPDNTLTPQDFGAVENDNIDDSAALQQWWNAPASYSLYCPVGAYIYASNTTLARANRGAVMLRGGSSAYTQIRFTGTAGMRVSNTAGGTLGLVSIQGISLVCAGPKAAGTDALYAATQHEAQPGFILDDVQIVSDGTNAWPTGLHLHDCSYTSYRNVFIKGTSYTDGTRGVLLTNSMNRPIVNHTLAGLNVLAVDTALVSRCIGPFGMEGLNTAGFRAVAVRVGLDIYSRDYSATWLTFSDTHVECFGGYALRVRNYSQVHGGGTNDWYIHGTPKYGLEFNNCVGITGHWGQVVSFDSLAYSVGLTGSGGGHEIRFNQTADHGSVRELGVSCGNVNVRMDVARTWSGLKGPYLGDVSMVNDPCGNVQNVLYVPRSVVTAADGAYLRYDAASGLWKASSAPTLMAPVQLFSASAVVDASKGGVVLVANGGSAVTLTFDYTKLTPGQLVYVRRYDNSSTGTITLTTTDAANHYVQDPNGNFGPTWNLPTTSNLRQAGFVYIGGHLQPISY